MHKCLKQDIDFNNARYILQWHKSTASTPKEYGFHNRLTQVIRMNHEGDTHVSPLWYERITNVRRHKKTYSWSAQVVFLKHWTYVLATLKKVQEKAYNGFKREKGITHSLQENACHADDKTIVWLSGKANSALHTGEGMTARGCNRTSALIPQAGDAVRWSYGNSVISPWWSGVLRQKMHYGLCDRRRKAQRDCANGALRTDSVKFLILLRPTSFVSCCNEQAKT